MRARLLEATVECLVEAGHLGASTARIEQRAGVSRGARMHHFPAKSDLLSAAVDHVYRGLRESFESRIQAIIEAGAEPDRDRFSASFQLLWSNFLDPRYAAVLELFVLARSDDELRAKLHAVAERHHANMQRRAAAYFADAPKDVSALVPPIMESIHAAMEGLAIRRVVFGEDDTERLVLANVEAMARERIRAHFEA